MGASGSFQLKANVGAWTARAMASRGATASRGPAKVTLGAPSTSASAASARCPYVVDRFAHGRGVACFAAAGSARDRRGASEPRAVNEAQK